MVEEWRDIPGYEGYYQVSNLGRVKGLSRWIDGNKRGYTREHILKEANNRGYRRVLLSVNRKSKNFSVHRLVALVFIPNPNNYPQVNHIDGDKTNNAVTNLEWCTSSHNNLHKFKVLGYSLPKETRDKISAKFKGKKWSEECKRNLSNILKGKRKPTLCKKVLCINTGEMFNSVREAAQYKNVSASNITMCCHGRIGQTKGYRWRFVDE